MRYVQAVYPEASPDRAQVVQPSRPSGTGRDRDRPYRAARPSPAASSTSTVHRTRRSRSACESRCRPDARGHRRACRSLLAVRTDDNGSFRVFGLQAGEYIVIAQPPPVPTGRGRRVAAPGHLSTDVLSHGSLGSRGRQAPGSARRRHRSGRHRAPAVASGDGPRRARRRERSPRVRRSGQAAETGCADRERSPEPVHADGR